MIHELFNTWTLYFMFYLNAQEPLQNFDYLKITTDWRLFILPVHITSTTCPITSTKRQTFVCDINDSISRGILFDDCLQQNSKKALGVPPCSPDHNPIKKFSALITKTVCKQAVKGNIVRETFDEFVTRVRKKC